MQFFDALGKIPKQAIVLEIGPSAVLHPAVSRSLGTNPVLSVSNATGTDQVETFFQSIGQLYALGVDMDVSCLFQSCERVPASSHCPDLGQLVTWDHQHSWSTYVVPYPKVSIRSTNRSPSK